MSKKQFIEETTSHLPEKQREKAVACLEASIPDSGEDSLSLAASPSGSCFTLKNLSILTAVTVIALAVLHFAQLEHLPRTFKLVSRSAPAVVYEHYESIFKEPERTGFSDEEQLLLFETDDINDPSAGWKQLHKLHPNDPAYFSAYAATHVYYFDTLPENYQATVDRLAPDNGWFDMLHAAALSKSCLKRTEIETDSLGELSKTLDTYEVTDADQYQQALAALKRCSEKGEYDDYSASILERKLKVIPPYTSFPSYINSSMLLIDNRYSPSIQAVAASRILRVQVNSATTPQDLTSIIQLWKKIDSQQLNTAHELVELLASKAWSASISQELQSKSHSLKLDKLNQYLAEKNLHTDQNGTRPPANEQHSVLSDRIKRHGSMFNSWTAQILPLQVANPPAISESSLKPNRLAEHATFSIMGFTSLSILGGIIAIPLCLTLLRRRYTSSATLRILATLSRADKTWIFAAALFPTLFYLLLHAIPGFSPWDTGLAYTQRISNLALFGAVLTQTILLTALMIQLRLHHRHPALFQQPHRNLWGPALSCVVLSVVLALAPLLIDKGFPVIPNGSSIMTGYGTFGINGLAILIGLQFITALILVLRPLFCRKKNSLFWQTHHRLLLPAVCVIALLHTAITPAFSAMESYWIQRDTNLPDFSKGESVTKVERDVAAQLKIELQEKLEKTHAEIQELIKAED